MTKYLGPIVTINSINELSEGLEEFGYVQNRTKLNILSTATAQDGAEIAEHITTIYKIGQENLVPCDDFSCFDVPEGVVLTIEKAPMEALEEGYTRNLLINSEAEIELSSRPTWNEYTGQTWEEIE